MTVVLLSADLMAASRAQGAAAQVGLEVRSLTCAEQAIAECNDLQTSLLLVDLQMPELDVSQLVNALRANNNTPPRIVAYGQHVHEERLAAARQAGCDEVISRGQFFARLTEIFQFAARE